MMLLYKINQVFRCNHPQEIHEHALRKYETCFFFTQAFLQQVIIEIEGCVVEVIKLRGVNITLLEVHRSVARIIFRVELGR